MHGGTGEAGAGRRRRIAALVRRHHARLLRRAEGVVRDAAVAEEVVQETWLAALRTLDGYRGEAPIGAWLTTLVLNRARARAARERRVVPLSALPHEPPGEVPADAELAPDRLLERAEASSRGAAALRALPPAQREAVRLHDLEGLAAPAVGARLGVTLPHLRVLLHRGRARLLTALGG